MESSNPAFSAKALQRFAVGEPSTTMTRAGSLGKTAYALTVLILSAIIGWTQFSSIVSLPIGVLITGGVVLLIVGLVAAFRPNPILVTIYAVLEGLYLGIISKLFESAYDGIVSQAILLTMAVTLGMLVLYASGAVKVTEKLRSVIMIATVGVLIYILAEFIISLFSPGFLTIVTSGVTGIVIAAIIVIIAALNLLLDFDFLTRGVEQKLDKKAEWYFAFGLMVTLIWLYISILRLLGASRR